MSTGARLVRGGPRPGAVAGRPRGLLGRICEQLEASVNGLVHLARRGGSGQRLVGAC